MSTKEDEIRKKLSLNFDPESAVKKLSTYKNIANQTLFETKKEYVQETKIQLIADKSIDPAKFIPTKENPQIFRAHPTTIKAIRKDLFMGGEDFVDLEVLAQCLSCKETIDFQFYVFCPYCEGKLITFN
jgi:hypothetical protein